MFCQSPRSFEDFEPENYFSSSELACYKARAQALRPRFPWSEALLPVWNVTLIHLSANVPGKVAYFANVKSLMENRLTRTSPEMFLERMLVYAPEEIKGAWAVEVLGQTLPEIKFVLNTDPDGWERVYDRGPNSCMAGSSLVRQYAHPKNNLALAYHEKDGRITHRTIVNTQTKNYLRIYGGDDNGYFATALAKQGFKHSYDTLAGEMIHASYSCCSRCDNDVLIGPYLDGHHQGICLINRNEGRINSLGDGMYNGDEPDCGCDGEDDDAEY